MGIEGLTSAAAVEHALAEYDTLGGPAFRKQRGYTSPTRYYLSHGQRLYEAPAIAWAAYSHQHPAADVRPSGPSAGGDSATSHALQRLGFTVLDSHTESVEAEKEWRLAIWANLAARRNGEGTVTPDVLRSVGAYGNFRGIWTDKSRTEQIDPSGVTIGLKHTGLHYPDDLSDAGLLYHYPVTRLTGRDLGEVNSTKTAARLRLPVFVITEHGAMRGVRLAWVEGWEDVSKLFLVSFGDVAPDRVIDHDTSEEQPFVLEGNRRRQRSRSVTDRPDQARFKIDVFHRYGPECPLSGIAVSQMVEAAHLRGYAEGGSSDARNGLPMNAALHRAFDAHLFAINPDTLRAEPSPGGPSLASMGIIYPQLAMENLPHPEALRWRYDEWLRRTGQEHEVGA